VHTHQIYGSVFGVLNLPIPALLDEVSFTLGEPSRWFRTRCPAARSWPPMWRPSSGTNANAYIIQNHGIIVLGKNMDKALLAAELLEKVAHIYYLALSTGKPVTLLPDSIREIVRGLESLRRRKGRNKNVMFSMAYESCGPLSRPDSGL